MRWRRPRRTRTRGRVPIRRRSLSWRLENRVELLGMGRADARLVPIQRAGLHQPGQRFLEAERPRLPRNRDLLMQVLQRVLAQVLPRAVADHQEITITRK